MESSGGGLEPAPYAALGSLGYGAVAGGTPFWGAVGVTCFGREGAELPNLVAFAVPHPFLLNTLSLFPALRFCISSAGMLHPQKNAFIP